MKQTSLLIKPNCVLENVSLAKKTYYQMGGRARFYAIPTHFHEVQEVLWWANSEKLICAVLGLGSNLIFADEPFNGLVISLEKLNRWHWQTDTNLYVEAGVTNTEVAEICLKAGRKGASWMYRMPGQIGGTLRMNARCYGGEISHVVQDVLALDAKGCLKYFKSKEIFYGYKSTKFMDDPHVILGARLTFRETESHENLYEHMLFCESNRNQKNHFLHPSCGSTFKNNYAAGKPSGQIFDELGFKGKQEGQAQVSQAHANFIWNLGGAKTADVLSLATCMRAQAREVYKVELDLEVQPIGEFTQEQFEGCGMKNLGPSMELEKEKNKKYLVGLLNPNPEYLKTKSEKYPCTIFSSSFFEYWQGLNPFQGTVTEIQQLRSLKEAELNPEDPFLRWKMHISEEDQKQFNFSPVTPSGWTPELWNYPVCEIFFSHPTEKRYLEFELSPRSAHWIGLSFQGNPRCLKQNIHEGYVVEPKDCSITFSYELLAPYLSEIKGNKEASIKIQCAINLNGHYFLAPLFKPTNELKETKETVEAAADSTKASPAKMKADFHQPSKFWEIFLNV